MHYNSCVTCCLETVQSPERRSGVLWLIYIDLVWQLRGRGLELGEFEMADILTEKLESFKSFRVDAYCEG